MSDATSGTDTTMSYRLIDAVLVLVHANVPPSDSEFDGYLDFCKNKLPATCSHCMVVTPGPGPNAKQREQVNEILKRRQRPMKVAVVTDASMVRGIVTALSWFNPGTRAFPAGKINEALEHLDVQAGVSTAKIVIEVRKMQAALASAAKKK